jgi:hypothetical protein
MALALWFASELAAAPSHVVRAVFQHIAWWGAGPWLCFNLALTAALRISPSFRAAYFDSDLTRLDQHGWTTLGLGGFPWLHLMLGGCGLMFLVCRAPTATIAPARA